ncbi:unnamed protein product [Polarella glacialis]|uniref:Uncharacterized protein n=1 Tax=Polarella glacialis TaxID=89957 RepID=A0A813GPK4_POLGL|nr:unnamed protein product [Polarella glacialis]
MDSWMNTPVPSNGTQGPKRRKLQPGSLDEKFKRLTIVNGKLGLHLAARSRLHDACNVRVITLGDKHPVSIAMTEAGRAYFLRKKTVQPQQLGSPRLYVWAPAILAVRKLQDIPEPDLQLLNAHVAAYDAPGSLSHLVNVCTISKAWAPETVRLEFAVAEELQLVLQAVLKALANTGGDLKAGPPPKSKHERAVAKLLLELGEGPEIAGE